MVVGCEVASVSEGAMRYHANVNVRMQTSKRFNLRSALWKAITPMFKVLPRSDFIVRVIVRGNETMTRKEALDQLMSADELLGLMRR